MADARIPCGDGYSQVGMSDDGIAIYECDRCGATSVGITYDHDCKANLLSRRSALLAAGDGRSLANRADEVLCDRIDRQLAALDA